MDALKFEGRREAEAHEISDEIGRWRERLLILGCSCDIPEAAISQQQRVRIQVDLTFVRISYSVTTELRGRVSILQILERASDALSEHLQRLSLSRSFSFKRRIAAHAAAAPSQSSEEPEKVETAADSTVQKEAHKEVEVAAAVPSNVLSISGIANTV